MTAEKAPADMAPNPRRWQSLVAVSALVALVWIQSDGFVIAVPSITKEIGGTSDQMAWAVNGFLIAICMAAFFGRLGDTVGNRRMIATGSAILVVGSVIGALVRDPTGLILARVVQGIGGTAIFTCALSAITIQFPPHELARAISIKSAMGYAAGGLATLIIAGVLELLGWRAIFWVVVPLALIGLAVVVATTPETRDRRPGSRLDLSGALALTAGFLVASYALIESDEITFARFLLIAGLAGALFALFALIESRARDPLIPLSVWRRPTFTASIVVNFAFNGLMVGLLYLLALYLQTARGLSSLDAAVLLLGATVTLIAANPLGTRLVQRERYLMPVLAGMLLIAAGCLIVMAGVKGDSEAVIVLGLVVFGSAVGIQVTSISTLQVSSAGATKGTASGVVGVMFGASGAMGVALATALMQNSALRSLRDATGTDRLEGISHTRLVDVRTGSLPIDSVSPAGQKIVIEALDQGIVVATIVFAALAVAVFGLALVMLREVELDEG
jgi:MFS family permease